MSVVVPRRSKDLRMREGRRSAKEWAVKLRLQPGSPPFEPLHNVQPSRAQIRVLTRARILRSMRPGWVQLPQKTLPERKRGVGGLGPHRL